MLSRSWRNAGDGDPFGCSHKGFGGTWRLISARRCISVNELSQKHLAPQTPSAAVFLRWLSGQSVLGKPIDRSVHATASLAAFVSPDKARASWACALLGGPRGYAQSRHTQLKATCVALHRACLMHDRSDAGCQHPHNPPHIAAASTLRTSRAINCLPRSIVCNRIGSVTSPATQAVCCS